MKHLYPCRNMLLTLKGGTRSCFSSMTFWKGNLTVLDCTPTTSNCSWLCELGGKPSHTLLMNCRSNRGQPAGSTGGYGASNPFDGSINWWANWTGKKRFFPCRIGALSVYEWSPKHSQVFSAQEVDHIVDAINALCRVLTTKATLSRFIDLSPLRPACMSRHCQALSQAIFRTVETPPCQRAKPSSWEVHRTFWT